MFECILCLIKANISQWATTTVSKQISQKWILQLKYISHKQLDMESLYPAWYTPHPGLQIINYLYIYVNIYIYKWIYIYRVPLSAVHYMYRLIAIWSTMMAMNSMLVCLLVQPGNTESWVMGAVLTNNPPVTNAQGSDCVTQERMLVASWG